MSCIAGIFERAGVPVEPAPLTRMLASMRERAPDGNEVRCDGNLGLALAFLSTGKSGAEAQHPITLDGDVWLTADARIDGRTALVSRLRTAGRRVNTDVPHAELILHAYHAFADGFLDHLMGDFAFALWDRRARRLICARDHFGVRPFYYFQSGTVFGFASDIDALLTHPDASHELDDVGVADFLLFGTEQDPDRTIYRDIKCLPPASRLDVALGTVNIRTYWRLPKDVETRRGSETEYVERFTAIFEQAVTDRLPDNPVAFQLSGGLDSTAIAAVATSAPDAAARPTFAYTVSARSLVPEDDERDYATAAAKHLGIPLFCQELGDYDVFERAADATLRTSSPLAYPLLAAYHDALTQVGASGARVLLSGHGGDSVMAPSTSYYPRLWHERRFLKLAAEVWHYARHTGSLGGMGLRSAMRRLPPESSWSPPMPDWLSTDLAGRVDVHDRWRRGWLALHKANDAYQQLTQPWLSRNLHTQEVLRAPLVVRYPFLDLRLVEFLMGLPNFMTRRKRILRRAMHARLPDSITTRSKTSMRGDVARVIVTGGKRALTAELSLASSAWVDAERYARALDEYRAGKGVGTTWASLAIISSLALGHWLRMREKDLT